MVADVSIYLIGAIGASILMIIMAIGYAFKKFKHRILKLYEKIKKKMIFNGIIRSLTIIYIQFCIKFFFKLQVWIRRRES